MFTFYRDGVRSTRVFSHGFTGKEVFEQNRMEDLVTSSNSTMNRILRKRSNRTECRILVTRSVYITPLISLTNRLMRSCTNTSIKNIGLSTTDVVPPRKKHQFLHIKQHRIRPRNCPHYADTQHAPILFQTANNTSFLVSIISAQDHLLFS